MACEHGLRVVECLVCSSPRGIPLKLSGAETDTLVALVEQGPLWDGDVPSKAGRNSLLEKGLAVRVVVKGDDGWQAATYAGRDAYKAMYPGPDGQADTINEAKVNRTMQRALRAASRANDA